MENNIISLIANSGIQFHKFDLEIDPNADMIRSIGFWENFDPDTFKITLEYAVYLPEYDRWVSKRQLIEEGFLDEDGKLFEDININLLKALDTESETYSLNDIETPLEYFEGKWIPIPYFETTGSGASKFGPTNWARLRLFPIDTASRVKKYQAVVAFDTKIRHDFESLEDPVIYGNNDFLNCSFSGDLEQLLKFCNEEHECGWVEEYLADIYHGGKANIPQEFPTFKYISHFIYFLKYLSATEAFPTVRLYTDEAEKYINVDLVLDIGNSNTCGILFESAKGKSAFEFTEVKKLKIQDLSMPIHAYDEPFSMRLAFYENDFGEIGFQSSKFRWPSFIRVGKEAKRLIYKSTVESAFPDQILVTNHSSPKRYLWDGDESDMQWELIRTNGQTENRRRIYIEGISEQFTKDGSFTNSMDQFGITSNFSRKSLMTFALIEILAHAYTQINSFDFRTYHGETTRPRRLRKIVVTCPTAMVQEEQLALRQCAEDASIALSRFYKGTYKEPYHPEEDRDKVEIIPSVKDLKKDLSQVENRKDWIYDEATCCQLVFLYAEISKRYLNKCEKYFELYGKHRTDLYDYDKKSITIASVDIGAGTADLMISAYKYDEAGVAVLTPVPLYWESFNLAGDNLLKAVIQQVIIEGQITREEDRGCTGVVENFARDQKVSQVEEKLNSFFGKDVNLMSFRARQMRRKFNTQISVPIAERYLEHTRQALPDQEMSFGDFFQEYQPSPDLLDYFEEHFGFRFEAIKWKLSASKVNQIIELVFEPLIKQICTLVFVKRCDFLLLAGRPTGLHKIGDLFMKFYPVSPDKIIMLNEYRVGRWYPFQDGNGYFTDRKSIVAVGASVALMGGKLDKLSGFRLKMDTIKTDLTSTAEYIGIYDRNTTDIQKIFISPDSNKSILEVPGLPIMIGFKRLPAHHYPGRAIYLLEFDDEKIAERKRNQLGDISAKELQSEVDDYKMMIKRRMPLKVRIYREYRENRERLKIESIEDSERNEIGKSMFKFRLKTLDEDKGYWLDTGEFSLKIRAK